MSRQAIMTWLVLVGICSGLLFHVSYQVQNLEAELGGLNRQIVQEQEAIHILHAEWAYLNDPQRLQKLVDDYLPLGPMAGTQFAAAVTDVPEKLPPIPGVTDAPIPKRKPLSPGRPAAVAKAPAGTTGSSAKPAPAAKAGGTGVSLATFNQGNRQ
ncbi:MAG TPA: hypothetical protein VEH84_06605 [Alphaproteobacteria bacterium]|nr:hypothetical protein [Alphaproteobacteria bacterium]